MNDRERQEQLDAQRFAAALEAIDEGRDPQIDRREDPELAVLVSTASAIGRTWHEATPAAGYVMRSRSLVLHSMAPRAPAAVEQPAREPFHRSLRRRWARWGVLAPVASAAAAAAVTFAVMLATQSDPLISQPDGLASSVPGERFDDAARPPVTDPFVLPDSLASHDRSVVAELRRLEAALKLLQDQAQAGQHAPSQLLRVVTEATATVASIIDRSPEAVTEQTVITYLQTTNTSQSVLDGVDAADGDQGALAAARRAASDGFQVAEAAISASQVRSIAEDPEHDEAVAQAVASLQDASGDGDADPAE